MKWKQHFSQFKNIVTLFACVDKVLERGKDTLQMQMQMQMQKKKRTRKDWESNILIGG